MWQREIKKMKKINLAISGAVVAFVFVFGANVALATNVDDHNSEGRLVNVRIVEVGDERISVMTREGVEHVIAVCQIKTQVKRGKRDVHFNDLRMDDVVTIVLDEEKLVKFAKNIEVREMVAGNQQ